MSELIKTLQVWSENPNNNVECNVPSVIPCKDILCKECPMDHTIILISQVKH